MNPRTIPSPRACVRDSRARAAGRAVALGGLLLAGLISPNVVGGQAQSGSTKPPQVPVEGDPKAILEQRFKDIAAEKKSWQTLKEMIERVKDGKGFKFKEEDLKKVDLKSPEVQKTIQKVQELIGKDDLKKWADDPKKVAEANDLLKKIQTPPAPPQPPMGGEVPPIPNIPDAPPVPPALPDGVPAVPGPPAAEPPPEPEDPLAKLAEDFMGNLDRSEVGHMLLQSEAFQQFWKLNWGDAASHQSILGLEPAQLATWLEKVPRVELKNPFTGVSDLRPGSWNLPPIPKVGFKLPSLGPVSSPTASASLSAGSTVLVVVLICGAAMIVGLLLIGTRLTRRDGSRAWHPGPWPVDPSRVSTRGELVRAFHHLALLLVGRQAEHLNHRDIAVRVGESRPTAEDRSAADELARLYEQARYAPAAETLSADDMRRARTDLCSLAGAASA